MSLVLTEELIARLCLHFLFRLPVVAGPHLGPAEPLHIHSRHNVDYGALEDHGDHIFALLDALANMSGQAEEQLATHRLAAVQPAHQQEPQLPRTVRLFAFTPLLLLLLVIHAEPQCRRLHLPVCLVDESLNNGGITILNAGQGCLQLLVVQVGLGGQVGLQVKIPLDGPIVGDEGEVGELSGRALLH